MTKISELSTAEKMEAMRIAMGQPKIQVLKPLSGNPSIDVVSTTPSEVKMETKLEIPLVNPKMDLPKKPSLVKTKSTKTKTFDEYEFQYYNGAFASEPMGELTLERFFEAIKNPQGRNKKLLDEIQVAAMAGDLKLKQKLKSQLPAFTPCVKVSENRRIENIISYNGLAVLDFDGLEPEGAIDVKNILFEDYPFVIAAWISPSGKGVKAICSIPVAKNIDEFREYVFGIAKHFQSITSFDDTTVNPVLPLFIGEDKDILIRTNYKTFRRLGLKINSLRSQDKQVGVPKIMTIDDIDESVRQFYPPGSLKTKEEYSDIVTRIYASALNKITENGHPQFRGASVALGGYVISGYIDYEVAIELMENSIDNHPYLSKSPGVYKKTGVSAIEIGLDYPITLQY